MYVVKHIRLCRFLTVVLGVLLLAGSLNLFSPAAAFAGPPEDTVLEITGEGVTTQLLLTQAELEAMRQYEQVYSTINTWPTKRWYMARGVKLRELLARAGIKKEATLIKFIAADNYEMTLTAKELWEDERYYFPGLKENHPTDGSVPGSTKDKLAVEPVVALVCAEDSDDPEDMDDRNGLMLIIGQRAVTEQTWLLFVKYLKKIEVLLDAPEKWDTPKVNVPDGIALPVGTALKLENKNTDSDKIYYTTDGSDPTVNSPMFNWSARRWWEQREDVDSVNIPIEIVKEMITDSAEGRSIVVLKLRTIGPGKEDSEIVTYTFRIDPNAEDPTKLPGSPATGIILDRSALDLPVGYTFPLDATVEPFNALSKDVIWRSSDTSVATVDTRGLVTVVGPGTAVITVETADGSFKAACVINGPEGESGEDVPVAAIEEQDPLEKETIAEQVEQPREKLPVENETVTPDPADEQQVQPPAALLGEEEEKPEPERNVQAEELAGEWQRLASIADLAADTANDDFSPDQENALSQMQVFEMFMDTAIPLSLPEQPKYLELYITLVFLVLFFSGASKRYIEYTKEQ